MPRTPPPVPPETNSNPVDVAGPGIEQLRALLDQAPAMVASLTGPDHVYEYVNLKFQETVGPHRRVLGLPIREARPELAGQGIFELMDHVYATGEPHSAHEVAVPLDRHGTGQFEPAFVDLAYHPIRGADGRVRSVLMHAVDVTERVLADRERRKHEARIHQYERLLEGSGWGVAVGDAAGHTLIDVNQAFAAMHGYAVDDLVGADSSLVFAPESLPNKAPEYVGRTNTEGRHRYESIHRRKDGSTFPCLTDVIAVKDASGQVLYRIGTFQDLTEIKAHEAHLHRLNEELARQAAQLQAQGDELQRLYEEQRAHTAAVEAEVARRTEELRAANERLVASDRYKDEFLSVISHELRTPLNFITGFASILDDELPGPLNARQHEAIARILNGSDRMLMLVDDLLDFAKIQSGRLDLLPTPTAYGPLIDEVLGLMRPLADRKGLSLEADVDVPGRPPLDAARVAQVVTNLVGNALKFTPKNGRVRLAAYLDDGWIVTEVADTGPGIPEGDMSKLFERFSQLDMSATREVGGTGLGLAISKALVEAHGGAIGVRSVPGVGSTFWFRLPAGA